MADGIVRSAGVVSAVILNWSATEDHAFLRGLQAVPIVILSRSVMARGSARRRMQAEAKNLSPPVGPWLLVAARRSFARLKIHGAKWHRPLACANRRDACSTSHCHSGLRWRPELARQATIRMTGWNLYSGRRTPGDAGHSARSLGVDGVPDCPGGVLNKLSW